MLGVKIDKRFIHQLFSDVEGVTCFLMKVEEATYEETIRTGIGI